MYELVQVAASSYYVQSPAKIGLVKLDAQTVCLIDSGNDGDNRLISPKSSHRRGGLAPRCRLIASWGCSRSQGLGCSPIKVVRELGSERRETVRSLSVAGVGNLRRPVLSTRGPGWTYRWCTSCSAKGMAG